MPHVDCATLDVARKPGSRLVLRRVVQLRELSGSRSDGKGCMRKHTRWNRPSSAPGGEEFTICAEMSRFSSLESLRTHELKIFTLGMNDS